ncbi:hypothetical protein ABID14_000428 [Peptoniphilus olsenii]|uniref:Uncharacterized protein n=1 Tax=Peptoniphilus olsenii TaxID=411570 RepID=A0ABV2J828_9FIRM
MRMFSFVPLFGALFQILILVLVVLAIVALIKYIKNN